MGLQHPALPNKCCYLTEARYTVHTSLIPILVES